MANMTLATTALGTMTFSHNPAKVRRMYKERRFKYRDTLESSMIFDWRFKTDASGLKGSRWILRWPKMPRTEWTNFRNYYESTEVVTWDPKERARIPGEKYTVIMHPFTSIDLIETTRYLEDIEIQFEITGVV